MSLKLSQRITGNSTVASVKHFDIESLECRVSTAFYDVGYISSEFAFKETSASRLSGA